MSITHERSIFQTGYADMFRPEDRRNPFHRLYARKRRDVLALAPTLLAQKSDARVLDVGGGMGRVAVPLATQYNVHLCDVSEEMLRMANEAASAANIPAGRFSTGLVDASKRLPFEDGSFDLVICLDLLVHLPDPEATVRELYRVLRPGGAALIDATNGIPLWVFFYPRYLGKRPARWLKTIRHGGVHPEWANIVHHMRRKTFLGWLRGAGFAVSGAMGRCRFCPSGFWQLDKNHK